jgi:hypothetical protein
MTDPVRSWKGAPQGWLASVEADKWDWFPLFLFLAVADPRAPVLDC